MIGRSGELTVEAFGVRLSALGQQGWCEFPLKSLLAKSRLPSAESQLLAIPFSFD